MKPEDVKLYVCPLSKQPLALDRAEICDGDIVSGELVSPGGLRYPVTHGIPDLTYPQNLAVPDAKARSFYDARADAYDAYLHLTFKTHGEDETTVRNAFVDTLELRPDSRVLEVACGTGRDSEVIASRLGPEAHYFGQDISPAMLGRCRSRLGAVTVPTALNVSNACYLPYPDATFDAVYSFGGLGEFSDIRRSLSEMVRVSKLGGRIVVGDESLPPWVRKTEFAEILTTTNKQFLAPLPLDDMPLEARQVRLRWVIGGVFYLIDFVVGDGPPKGNFDFEIPGVRGGTLRTRYLGQLEGVTTETKELAERARDKANISMHEWLDQVVREAANRVLHDGSR